MFKRVAN